MKKKKITKKIKGYAKGTSLIENWGTNSSADNAAGIAEGVGALGTMFSNATSGQKVTAAGVISGVASGAAAGASIGGPVGAIAGGALGGITSGMGSGGSVNEQTGDVTEASGIAGLFGHSKTYLRNKEARVKNSILARQNAGQVAADYYSQNGYNATTLAANGGIIPTTKAKLSKGELLRDSDGIHEIPGSNGYANGEDDVLAQVEVGSQVLSNKLKVPGTNKTFAEMGKKLINKKGKGKGIYAQNSQMLNDRNNQMKYNQLLAMQENMKNSGSQSKKGIIKAAKGTPYIDSIDPQELMRFKGITPYVETPTATTKVAGVIDISKIKIPEQYTTEGYVSNVNAKRQKKFNYFNDLAGDISQLALPMSKAFNKAKSDKVNAYSYTPQFLSTNYDINPQLSEIDRSYAMSRYNQANISPNTGAGMAFGLQSAVARNNAMNNLYSQKYNTQNQLRAQNANIYNQWGNQYANAQHIASVEQAQNDTAAKQYNNQALTELSTTLQSMRKDKRLTKRGQVMLEYMKDYLGYGTKDNILTALINGFE